MQEELLLEKYSFLLKEKGYDVCKFSLRNEKLNKFLENLSEIDLLIIEVENVDYKIKKIIKEIKEKFENCKILILVPEFDEKIETLISEFAIDAYLTFPILSSQFLRSIYLLEKF